MLLKIYVISDWECVCGRRRILYAIVSEGVNYNTLRIELHKQQLEATNKMCGSCPELKNDGGYLQGFFKARILKSGHNYRKFLEYARTINGFVRSEFGVMKFSKLKIIGVEFSNVKSEMFSYQTQTHAMGWWLSADALSPHAFVIALPEQ